MIPVPGKGRGVAQTEERDGSSHSRRALLSPSAEEEGGDVMVTYGELFAYTLVLINIIGLCIQIAQFRNKKK